VFSFLTTLVEKGKSVIPLGHARKDSISPNQGINFLGVVGLILENQFVVCAPNLPMRSRAEDIRCNIESPVEGDVVNMLIVGAKAEYGK